ncbi:glycosyltransferase [Sphingobium sp. TCM1]|jgi:glycosyltransferase involved in cell wall biosynthesis|uniref:glycosyltransferase n=1 Tax=Sphingobium sp. TCM1 TaxID=453246 RepID=UPI001E4ED316|nr:glycosyltransferase [Sphingobium sp. TCM1]
MGPARSVICVYVHALVATGVVRNARLIAADLAARGHGVQLVTALPGGEAVPGVAHHALLPQAHPSRLREKAQAALALRRHLLRERPAMLISAGNHGHGTAWAGSRGVPGLKRVYRISNDIMRAVPGAPSGGLKRLGRSATARLIAVDAAHLVLVSPTLADTPAFAGAARGGRLTVIANGIDAGAARRKAEGENPHPWLGGDAPVLLAIGRLAPQKNFATLLRAFALLRRQRPARLIILGESRDDARETLTAQARQMGVADDLALPGTVDNVFPWLARCDGFVLPSWWEGSANVLLEAMAVDAPCVASISAGNAAQLLDDGRYGLLVDPADAHAMATAMDRQLDPATRIRPGERIAHFGMASVSAGWADLAGRLLAG